MADIGPYRILALIAESSQALSYRAVHTGLDREVFLKVLPAGGPGQHERRARFEREAKALARIDHPAVVRVYDFGEADGRLYLASELVDGPDLARRIEDGPIPWAEAKRIALVLLEGLQALHHAGIIHRDIKPSNIVLSSGGPKLADLGLARLTQNPAATQSDTLIGTPAYMDPAMLRGSVADEQADLFSLGATLVEAVTGQRAFPGETFQEVIRSLVETDPTASLHPDIPDEARRFLSALLHKDPARRPRTAAEARRLLEAPPPGGPGRSRARRMIPVGAMVLLAIGTGLALLRSGSPPESSPDTTKDLAQMPPDSAERIEPSVTPSAGDPTGQVAATVPSEVPPPPSGPHPVAVVPAVLSDEATVPHTGTLWIATSPWAEIRIDGTPRDTTPLSAPLDIPPGRHTVTLTHPAYPPITSVLSILPGQEESLLVSLADSAGFLMVHTEPWAYLNVDGEHVGTTPLTAPLALRPGGHAVRAENPFVPAAAVDVQVVRGETTTVRIPLRSVER